MSSAHIECSKLSLQKYQSPYGLQCCGDFPKPLSLNSKSTMEVFDFVEDDVSVSGSASYRKRTFGKKRLPSASPAESRPSHSKGIGDNNGFIIIDNSDDSDNSQGSSPSLSVTEFVLKRKTKKERSPPGAGAGDWQYMTSYNQSNSMMSTTRGDMLGSPHAFQPQSQSSSNLPIRRCMKRRLCEDDMIDTQILEITRCIKRQQRVTPKYNKE
ncbi:uncharacterized protein LOC135491465 [Lineus longissimus]|uniref:uncharacterized protein LOC135491465 n=1 Tax=Lineus longissimus TaxID=88925 RepID=UPI00315D4DE5